MLETNWGVVSMFYLYHIFNHFAIPNLKIFHKYFTFFEVFCYNIIIFDNFRTQGKVSKKIFELKLSKSIDKFIFRH